jgi:hypothetical protein
VLTHITVVWEKLSTITIKDVTRTIGIYRYNVCLKKGGENHFDLEPPSCTVTTRETQQLEAKIQGMTMKYELDSVLFFTRKMKHIVCYSRFIPDAGS